MVGPAANNTGKPALNDTPVTPDRQDIPIRDAFLGWQCRIRQMAVREHAGYPLPDMRPRLRGPDGRVLAEAITVLIIQREPEKATNAFRHVVRRTRDPLERHEAAVKMLSSVFYQHPGEFSDMLTALFAIDSGTAASARAAGECVLEFAQFNQSFRLSCAVAELDREVPAWQATYWHNHMFNPTLPGAVTILAFTPDWRGAEADPEVS